MSTNNEKNLGYEYNDALNDEIILNKVSSHDPGEFNEIKITNGLLTSKEETESSSSDTTTKITAMSLTTSISMFVGIGTLVIGTIFSINTSIKYLKDQSYIGISYAKCIFESTSIDVDNFVVNLLDFNGNIIQSGDLKSSSTTNYYEIEFNDLTPNTTYFIEGTNSDGKIVSLGNSAYFTTLSIPKYQVSIDKTNYDKVNKNYELTFNIDNPNKYEINAFLICENDNTLNQNYSTNLGSYTFILPSILSSYRLELYQEEYLVGQTTFSDYSNLVLDENTLDIGLKYFYVGFDPGDMLQTNLKCSAKDENTGQEYDITLIADGGYIYAISNDILTPSTSYILKIYDQNRPSFVFYSYKFKTLDIPNYDITIDDSLLDIENKNYTLKFVIDNTYSKSVDAYFTCYNDETLNFSDIFWSDELEVNLNYINSVYRLDLKQEGYDVGSIEFSYYTPLSLIEGSSVLSSSSIKMELNIGSVSSDTIFLAIAYKKEDESVSVSGTINYSTDSNTLIVEVQDLEVGTDYILKILDYFRNTFVYFTYEFATINAI